MKLLDQSVQAFTILIDTVELSSIELFTQSHAWGTSALGQFASLRHLSGECVLVGVAQ